MSTTETPVRTEVPWVSKSPEDSSKFREEGNILFNRPDHGLKNHYEMLKLYTKAAAYAPNGSEELAKAYGNRSALAFHCKNYGNSIIDIDRAIAITKSAFLKIKLLYRKSLCLKNNQFSGDEEDIKKCIKEIQNSFSEIFKQIKSLENTINSEKEKDLLFQLREQTLERLHTVEIMEVSNYKKDRLNFSIESPQENIPCASSKIQLRYNEEFGKHIIATEDIKTGETIIVEKPFTFPQIKLIYIVCSHCLMHTHTGLPCTSCVFHVYCSEKCKDEAWEKYHDIECTERNVFKLLSANEDKAAQLSLLLRRTLISIFKENNIKDKKSYVLSQFQSATNLSDKDLVELFNGKPYNKQKMTILCSLKANISDQLPAFKYFATILLKIMDHILIDDVPSFQEIPVVKEWLDELAQKEWHQASKLIKDLFTSMEQRWRKKHLKEKSNTFGLDDEVSQELHPVITKLLMAFMLNCFGVDVEDNFCYCDVDSHPLKSHDDGCLERAGSVFSPFSSFMNHSCIPNARYFYTDGCLVGVTTRPIKKNEQVFTSYLDINDSTEVRQQMLLKRYNFKCTCLRCEKDWKFPVEIGLSVCKTFLETMTSKKIDVKEASLITINSIAKAIDDEYDTLKRKNSLFTFMSRTAGLRLILGKYHNELISFNSYSKLPKEC